MVVFQLAIIHVFTNSVLLIDDNDFLAFAIFGPNNQRFGKRAYFMFPTQYEIRDRLDPFSKNLVQFFHRCYEDLFKLDKRKFDQELQVCSSFVLLSVLDPQSIKHEHDMPIVVLTISSISVVSISFFFYLPYFFSNRTKQIFF